MGAEAQAGASREREWYLRTLLVLQRPGAVFAALRDDSDADAQAREEPLLAVLWLGGIAAVLGASVAQTLLDDPARDGLVVAVWAFVAGGLTGALGYWLFGALVYGAARALGGQGTYRRARHLVGLAAVPLAVSLFVVWPLAISLYGGDLFRSGGADSGTGGSMLGWVEAAVGLWCVTLVAFGIRAVHGWTWPRSLATLALAAVGIASIFAMGKGWTFLFPSR